MAVVSEDGRVLEPDWRTAFDPQGTMVPVWDYRGFECLVDGPAGTGKTRGIQELTCVVCQAFPGCRILWVRKKRVDMTESVLKTFETLVLPKNHYLSAGVSRETRRKYQWKNGSEIIISGLDDVEKTQSMEVDWVIAFEAAQLTAEDWEGLIRAMRWNVIPYKRMIAECNPKYPQHWLIQRAVKLGKMARFQQNHKANPAFWDARKQQWTPRGEQYVNSILQQYTGARYKRMVQGLWVGDDASFFDLDVLGRYKETNCETPWSCGLLTLTAEGKPLDAMLGARNLNAVRWKPYERIQDAPPHGYWKLWCELVKDKKGRLRPPQNTSYVVAADISLGQKASNSVISIGDAMTRRKIAEFATNTMDPAAFARLYYAAALWAGGIGEEALQIYENNGVGGTVTTFLIEIVHSRRVYYHRSRRRGRRESSNVAGWTNTAQGKLELATELKQAYADGTYDNPSSAAIDEAMGWIYYEDNSIGTGDLGDDVHAAERKAHGDRVIVDMILNHGMSIAQAYEPEVDEPEPGTIEYMDRYGRPMPDDEEMVEL